MNCPGCDARLNTPQDCDRCEYFNLENGRYHYCGRDECYCRKLPGRTYMRPQVLQKFKDRFWQTVELP